jgi:hypothetical protein
MTRLRRWGVPVVSVTLFVMVPSVFVVVRQRQSFAAALMTVADNALVFGVLLTSLLIASRRPRGGAGGAVITATFTTYFMAQSFLIIYWQVTGTQFDVLFALDSYEDVYRTLVNTLGRWLTGLAASLVVLYGVYLWLVWRWFIRLRASGTQLFASWSAVLLLALQVLTLASNRSEQRLVFEEIRSAKEAVQERSAVAPIFPDTTRFTTDSEENLFILHLESGNAIALSGTMVLDGKAYTDDYMPQMRAIARDGVFFPFFWGNSIQSNRALINILCGVANEAGRSLSYNPEKIRNPCLPELLTQAGYRSLFFLGFSAPDFMNYANLIPALGFKEFHDSRLVSVLDDDAWGVDDCTLYRKMFEYLRTHYPTPKRLFVYTEVSSHHYPYGGSPAYAHVHRFKLPLNFAEGYLNSYTEQDFCLQTFYEEFRRYAGDHSHLFIMPDHSWPVGLHNGNTLNDAYSFNENFLIPFLYLPPVSRRQEFRIGEQVAARPSLTDVLPTVFELLNDRPYPNSFTFLLKRAGGFPNHYEDCHVLVQPYGGGEIAIVKGNRKYVYFVSQKRLLRYDLREDWDERHPEVVAENISYATVRRQYYCERYQR